MTLPPRAGKAPGEAVPTTAPQAGRASEHRLTGAEHGTSVAAPPAGSGPRWLGRGLVAAGLAMFPWLGVLAATLPGSAQAAHWPAAWIGLDSMEALGLLSTGLLLIRGNSYCSLTAAVTAALVLTDAWFDVTTAAPGAALTIAIAMAACIEIPVSLLCAHMAVRRFPRCAPRTQTTPVPPARRAKRSALTGSGDTC
jgi:hypothetical protein